MDNSDIYRVASLRRSRNSSGIWRNTNDDVFSRSSRDEDDEEALKWASIERLPTYNRIRKGILSGLDGTHKEVDIEHLDTQERKNLVERLVRVAEDDNEKFLLKLKERMDRVDIKNPTIEVRFEHLNVSAEAYIGSRALPTVINVPVNLLEGFLNQLHILPSRKKHLSILHDVSGIIKPSRMTLLLGPPGSGKTSLLLALAGKLDPTLEVSGKITYNGHEMNEFVPRRTSAYISQNDLHIGEMTVREILAFSARCQGVGFRYEMLKELSRREVAANIKPDPNIDVYMKAAAMEGQKENVVTDYILKILGLDICADTFVGNEMMRGISGGQRKRVTTGEMLVGPAKALFMDEISTGLDSSTTFQIVNSLRQSVHILGGTAVIALLQPAPETYDLFDEIILLSDGQIVYQGPRENVLEFFESMGFKCPERKGVADFLQEVTSRKDQHQYWARNEPYYYVSVQNFVDAFHSFHIGRKQEQEFRTPFDKKNSHPAALTKSEYGVSKKELLKACFSREWLLMKRNSFVYVFKMMQLIFVAFIAMTIFLRTEMKRNTVTDGGVYMGAMFFAIVTVMFNGFAEVSMTIAKLPVFYKQRDLLFYPSWAYALPSWILRIPTSFAEVFIWIGLTYYVIGFDPNIFRMLKHFLILLLTGQMASGLFRLVAAVSRDMVIANTFGSFVLLVVMALGGFVMSRVNVKKWWIWGYWISPLTYCQNAIGVNEFLGHSWNHFPPNKTVTLGIEVLESRGIFTSASWYWIGAGALLGYIVLFNGVFTLALAYLNPGTSQAVLSEEALKEQHANRTGEVDGVKLSSKAKRSSTQSIFSGTDNELTTTSSESSITEASGGARQNKKGMVLPFTPYSITFDNIKYSVDMPQEMKTQGIEEDRLMLLKGISGAFRPGVLTALMGVSGAGKTTLMDVLAGRKTGGYIEGAITISGYPKKQDTFARISGYCEQSDIHSPNVTVYESLVYSAWLRLPPEVKSETRKMFIEEVMELVELKSLRGALVGLPGVNGLSTEQRKRLTIAVELVANPSIIFMDEPTSGLDARAAAIVMRTVRNTVDTGRTVVCTIHQPSIDIFEAFDELFLMKRGGEEVYVGPLGQNSCHLINYFEGIDGVPPIRDGYNPATWMLEVTSEAQEDNLGISFVEAYKKSELFGRNKRLINELSTPPPNSKDLYFSRKYSQSLFTQCKACLWKQHLSYWRDPPYTAMRIFFTAVIALMLGSIFWKQGKKLSRRQDIFNSMGAMYSAVLFIGTENASAVQPVVAVERTVFYRERAAGMYSALPYAFAQVAIEIPHVLLQTLIYGVVVYAMIDFQWTAAKFLWFMFYMFVTFLYFTYYGMMAVGLTPNHAIAAIVSSAFYSIWNLFAGFVIPRPRIPIWWRWYYWGCPVAYTLYGLVASQYGDIETNLEGEDTEVTVKQFLKSYYGYDHDSLAYIGLGLVGFTLMFAFIFAFSIKMLNFQRR
ncbi:Pleiotropic drug resistance abc transporter [Thalictrum thalictroides]|uniref:Pleiotropic drug resistance abc transporter n=1 Tax=Thalictrum thalictroides TaxID=46969 RepID=A0A7J6W963_THATH|nr:Pleiotropic drug resistance abc transporter [Thalictrum thalictroides]